MAITEHEKTQLTEEVQELCSQAWGKGVIDGVILSIAVYLLTLFAAWAL